MTATAALGAVVCVVGAQSGTVRASSRLDLLRQAFALLDSQPSRARDLLRQAGPGTELELVRQRAWLECLERGGSAANQWQLFLDQGPSDELERQAALGLGKALLLAGDNGPAVALLEQQGVAGSFEADEILLGCPVEGARERATRRLAARAPQRLRKISAAAERKALSALGEAERLERSAAWRAVGQPRRAISELERVKWRGERERERRQELARAHLDAGSPRRALRALPGGRDADVESLLLRAEAYRRQGWQRFPRSSAVGAFTSCLESSARAAEREGAGNAERVRAWTLTVECATESGDLRDGLRAWHELAHASWNGDRKEWLGRRLGVALARKPAGAGGAIEVARGLPLHWRCLRYWAAPNGDGRDKVLRELAQAGSPDLYAQWARVELGSAPPHELSLPAAAGPGQPPASVRMLLSWGRGAEASRHWRWIVRTRGATPREAVAAAELEVSQGRRNSAIRGLRAAMPELGTVEMPLTPADAVEAYLPLRWELELVAAAREFGLDPWLVAGVARQESVFNASARSPRGAVGVLQLLPGTARGHAVALGMGAAPDLGDPAVNLRLGARELARLVQRFGAVEPALAAYNAGEGRVGKWWKQWPERRAFTEAIPIPETYNYVRRVTYLAEAYRLVYAPLWREAP